ncbi:MarR family winged helix-turn-helix transcriptional regulator [Microbacterium sp. SORGH_AS_0888]|uniref:MarR family winged helix-turn-helix transcriptional regulator n=1 Tax=Microbacterium sp. SORGH_AS_0888 TaxID=3041791 RepID=UPI00358FA598
MDVSVCQHIEVEAQVAKNQNRSNLSPPTEGGGWEIGELRRAILALQRDGSRRLAAALRPFGLTPLQGEILAQMADGAPATLRELGEGLVCNVDPPSRAVDQLVKRGAIRRRRTPADRRKVVLHLTPDGYALADRALAAFASIDSLIADRLDESARLHTLTAIQRLSALGDHGHQSTSRLYPHR